MVVLDGVRQAALDDLHMRARQTAILRRCLDQAAGAVELAERLDADPRRRSVGGIGREAGAGERHVLVLGPVTGVGVVLEKELVSRRIKRRLLEIRVDLFVAQRIVHRSGLSPDIRHARGVGI